MAAAVRLLSQVQDMGLMHAGGHRNTIDAQLAAVIFMVARQSSLPLPLQEIVFAAQADKPAAAAHYSLLHAALRCPLPMPSTSLRAYVMRLAHAVLKRYVVSDPGAEPGAPVPPALQQPFVKWCLNIADLVFKMGWGEGRSPHIMAGGILLLVLGGLPFPQLGLRARPTTAEVAQLASSSRSSLEDTRIQLVGRLLQLTSLLPLGQSIDERNLLHYMPLITSLVQTLVAVRTAGGADQPGAPPPEP